MKLIYLSGIFYSQYANCPEILQKSGRPYIYLGITIDGVHFAIPFRHHITHKYAFLIDGTAGLDYTKAVVVSSVDQISVKKPWIDQKSYNAVKGKERTIAREMKKFVTTYEKANLYRKNPHYEYIRRCCSLQYFDKWKQ